MKGLNLGCGPVILEGGTNIEWENSDFADTESSAGWQMTRKRDFTKRMDDIADGSIDFIVAWHIIEHVGLHERMEILKEWLRVLTPGGRLFIACPDLTKIARNLVNRQGPWADWFICMVNVFGPYNGYVGDYHKWGYDDAELRKVLIEAGFSRCDLLNPPKLANAIGGMNASRLGFADYNIQLEAFK